MTFGLGTSVGPHIVGNTNTDGTARGAYGGSRMFFNAGGFSFDYSGTTSGARTWTTFVDINTDGVLSIRRGSSSNDNARFYNTDGNYSYIRTTAASNTNNTWFDAPLGATIWLGWDNPGQARTASTFSQVYVGTGRGTINETVLLRRGDIEGKDGAGTVNYRIVATGALGSHTFFNYGNVGIGTASPSQKLEIYNGNLLLNGASESVNPEIQLADGGGYGVAGAKIVYGNNDGYLYIDQYWTDSSSGIKFRVARAGTTVDAMTIRVSGNVGIGNTSPSNLLNVGAQAHTSPSDTNRILNFYSVGSELHNSVTPMSVGNSNTSTSQPQMVGLSLFNRSTTNNTWSPMITFGGLSTSGNYMNGAAGIAAQLPANTDDTNFRGGNLVFYTSGTVSAQRGLLERVRISSDGNVGIGTSSPTAKGLTIYQGGSDRRILLELNRPNTAGLQTAIEFTVGSSIMVGRIQHEYVASNYNHMSFTLRSVGGGDIIPLWLENSGNVGIGTTSPAVKLQVVGSNSTEGQLYVGNTDVTYSAGINFTTSGTNRGFVGWRHTNSGSPYSLTGIHLFNTDNSNIVFGTNGAVRAVIDLNGNMGIGTTSPSYRLDVAGQICMHDEAQDIDDRFYGGTFLRGWQSFNAGSNSSISYTTDTTCPVGIEVISVNTYVWARGPRLRLDKTQNYEVEIWIKRHTANTAGTFYFVVSNYDSSGNVIGGDGTDWHYPTNVTPPSTSWTKYSFVVGPYGGTKDHSSSARYISVGFIANYTGGNDVIYLSGFKCRPIPRYNNDALTIYNSGSIGIKKNNPSYALDVTGDIRATSDIIAYSDISVKENIRLIENPLDRINKIRGVKFDRIDTGEKDNLGFIAQEIEEEFPELVSTDDDGKKAVKYQNTVAVLVEAIKEQQIQIQEQKVQNGLLLNRIESLESQLQNRGI